MAEALAVIAVLDRTHFAKYWTICGSTQEHRSVQAHTPVLALLMVAYIAAELICEKELRQALMHAAPATSI